MGKSNVKNQEDVRRTVKNNSSSKSRVNPALIIIAILIIVGIVVFVINTQKHKKITPTEVSNYNYFVTEIDEKYGVIDKTGKTIIEPQYEYIQIPNPEKPIFVCLYDYNVETREYNSKVLNESGKEILTQYSKVQAIPNNNTSINNSYQTNILKYKDNDKFGLISVDGKKITNAIYENIETLEYKDGMLKIKKDDKYGVINISGNEIIKPEYNSIIADGYYDQNSKYEKAGYIINIRTDEGYRYGYINCKGKQTLDTMYTNIKRLTDIKDDSNVYLITYKNGQAGLLKNGQTIIQNEYEDIEYDSTSQMLSLQKNAKQGLYDLSGNMVLPIQYEELTFAGKYINAKKDNKLLVFDLAGVLQNDDSYKNVISVDDGKYSITTNRSNYYGVIDSNKAVVIENKYSYIEYAFDNYFIVSQNGKSGVINTNSNVAIPIEKNVVQNIKGTNIIQTLDSKTNVSEIYNKKMEKISTQKDAHIYIEDKYIEIISADNIEYFDFDGNKKEANQIFDNEVFAKEQNGKWGYVDKNGNTVLDFKYDMATNINKYGFGAIKQNGKWGVVDSKAKIIKEPVYKLTSYKPNFIGEYYEIGNNYQISYYSNEIK